MKKSLRCILPAILNLIPFLLTYFQLYSGGFRSTLIAIPLWLILCYINFAFAPGKRSFVILGILTVFFAGLTEFTSTILYYNRISSDSETLLVGWISGVFQILTVIIFSGSLYFWKKANNMPDKVKDNITLKRKVIFSLLFPIGAIISGIVLSLIGGMLWRTIYPFVYMQYIGFAIIIAGVCSFAPTALVNTVLYYK